MKRINIIFTKKYCNAFSIHENFSYLSLYNISLLERMLKCKVIKYSFNKRVNNYTIEINKFVFLRI